MSRGEGRGSNPLHQDAATARVVIENLARLQAEVRDLEEQVKRLERQTKANTGALRSHQARLDRLRIDKQIAGLPSWLWRRLRKSKAEGLTLEKVRPSPANLLVIAPKYPSEATPYGGQHVERRLRFYRRAGYSPSVLVPTPNAAHTQVRDGVRIHRASLDDLGQIIQTSGRSMLLVHHPEPAIWNRVRRFVGQLPVILWIHGYEARDWRDADTGGIESKSEEEIAKLDAVNIDRQRALSEAFSDRRVKKVFISNYVLEVATRFVGSEPVNYDVIHNVIDTETFAYRPRSERDRLRVLSVRSYATRTYATDLMRSVVEELAQRECFEHLNFEIRGDGRFFDEDALPLSAFDNVNVIRGILDAAGMANLMQGHGVMLIPTRLDTQGITMGESMASGMVVVSNAVAAIPEFIDEGSGLLSPPEDVKGMADSIERLYHDPSLFLRISAGAAERVRNQCGPQATIERELALIRAALAPQAATAAD